jgi:hypothetical protein
MRIGFFTILFTFLYTTIFAQQKATTSFCGDYALAKPDSFQNFQQIPKFFDVKKTLEFPTGTTLYIKPILLKNTNSSTQFKGSLRLENDTTNYLWQNIVDFTFNKEGNYLLSINCIIGTEQCKAFIKKIVVKKDNTTLNKEEPFSNELNIGTGIKYYPETVTNKNVFRDGYWQLLSGPPAAISYPTYGWTMVGAFSPDIVASIPKRFEGVHWLTLSSVFNSSANNMHPNKPYVFEKQFILKESDNISIELLTLFDNHIAIFIDNKRLYLQHPIASIEQLINKTILVREEMLERRETFNFNYNASFIKKDTIAMLLKSGLHKIKVELRSASQEIGFIFKGKLYSLTGKQNNFQPLGFAMTDIIKGAVWKYEKEN